jgi:hypothetical protein
MTQESEVMRRIDKWMTLVQAAAILLVIAASITLAHKSHAALPSPERVAESRKLPAESTRFIPLSPATESRIDIDEAHTADRDQIPLALWLFGAAALFLPASGMLTALRRDANRPTKF